MSKVSGTVAIARKPEEVFAYLDDFGARKTWQKDITTTKVLTDGPVRVGTEVEETRQMGKRTIVSRWRVTTHEPPMRSTFETYDGSMLKPSGAVTVAADGAGSRVTFEMEPNPMGITKVLMPIIARQIRKSINGSLQNLKSNLESS